MSCVYWACNALPLRGLSDHFFCCMDVGDIYIVLSEGNAVAEDDTLDRGKGTKQTEQKGATYPHSTHISCNHHDGPPY